MGCSAIIMAFLKQIIAFCSSTFDIGSDLLNALTFLGCIQTKNETSSLLDLSFSCPNISNMTSGDINETMNGIEKEVHQVWGIVSMSLILLPGVIGGLPLFILTFHLSKDWQEYCMVFIILLASIFFPIAVVITPLLAMVYTCVKGKFPAEYQMVVTSLTEVEAAIESSGQLALQMYTVINGYPITLIQKITILSSFFQIGKCSIMQDIEVKEVVIEGEDEAPTFCRTLKEILIRTPVYVPTIIFRIGSLVATMAYLRMYSIIPISFLLIELALLAWIRYPSYDELKYRIANVIQLTISNIGVFNSYAFLTSHEDDDDMDKFVVRSNFLTFLHHTTVIGIIIAIGHYQPNFFIKNLIIKPEDAEFHMGLEILIAIGAVSLVINLCRIYLPRVIKY